MTEKDLIDLGFERVDVTAEESGFPRDWYYYTYDFVRGLGLISIDNEGAERIGWYVEVFEVSSDIRFHNAKHLKKLINLINKAKV